MGIFFFLLMNIKETGKFEDVDKWNELAWLNPRVEEYRERNFNHPWFILFSTNSCSGTLSKASVPFPSLSPLSLSPPSFFPFCFHPTSFFFPLLLRFVTGNIENMPVYTQV